MCYYLAKEIYYQNDNIVHMPYGYYNINVEDYIPIFNKFFLEVNKIDDFYFGDMDDYDSRIKAFDKMIKYYENLK
jgi:hypothetical protein